MKAHRTPSVSSEKKRVPFGTHATRAIGAFDSCMHKSTGNDVFFPSVVNVTTILKKAAQKYLQLDDERGAAHVQDPNMARVKPTNEPIHARSRLKAQATTLKPESQHTSQKIVGGGWAMIVV